jgi:hypothetical protein
MRILSEIQRCMGRPMMIITVPILFVVHSTFVL